MHILYIIALKAAISLGKALTCKLAFVIVDSMVKVNLSDVTVTAGTVQIDTFFKRMCRGMSVKLCVSRTSASSVNCDVADDERRATPSTALELF